MLRLCSRPDPRCHLAQLMPIEIGKTHGPKWHNLRTFRKKPKKTDSSPVFVGICPTSFNSKDCRRITKSSTSWGFGAVQVAGSNLNFLGNISLAHNISNSQQTNNNENDCGYWLAIWTLDLLLSISDTCMLHINVCPKSKHYNVFFSVLIHLHLRFAKCPYREDGVPVVSGAPSESRWACGGDCMTRYAASWKMNRSVGK